MTSTRAPTRTGRRLAGYAIHSPCPPPRRRARPRAPGSGAPAPVGRRSDPRPGPAPRAGPGGDGGAPHDGLAHRRCPGGAAGVVVVRGDRRGGAGLLRGRWRLGGAVHGGAAASRDDPAAGCRPGVAPLRPAGTDRPGVRLAAVAPPGDVRGHRGPGSHGGGRRRPRSGRGASVAAGPRRRNAGLGRAGRASGDQQRRLVGGRGGGREVPCDHLPGIRARGHGGGAYRPVRRSPLGPDRRRPRCRGGGALARRRRGARSLPGRAGVRGARPRRHRPPVRWPSVFGPRGWARPID